MPRVHSKTKSSRGQQRTCGRCGIVIQPGQRYYTWSFRYGGPRFACAAHYPRPSELTQSKMSQVYAALEDAEDAVGKADTVEEVTDIVQAAATAIEEVASEYRDAAEAMGDAGAENEEKADALEGFAGDLEGWEPDVSEDDEDAVQQARDEAYGVLGDLPL